MATNYAKASYSEMYDFGTKSGKATIMGIHTPSVEAGAVNRATPYQMLTGFFRQFRKFRYAGCSVTLVPAAQLPADPLQVSFEAGQPSIDPRDLLNPVLFHGCHGESLSQALNSIYSKQEAAHSSVIPSANVDDKDFSVSLIANEYYSALSDRTWRKFGVQQPSKLPYLYPLVNNVSTIHPMLGKTGQMSSYSIMHAIDSQLKAAGQTGLPKEAIHDGLFFNPALEWTTDNKGVDGSTASGNFSQTWLSNGVSRLGWLPTTVATSISQEGGIGVPVNASPLLPKIFMGILMFPPSYTQELYFRMTITHFFEFRDFQGISMGSSLPANSYYSDLPKIGSGPILSSLEFDDPELVVEPTVTGVA